MNTKKTLIAERVKGDTWLLNSAILPEPNRFNTLTDTLEAYYQKTQYKGDFLLSPSTSKLYIIEEIEGAIKPTKKFNIYGDEE